MLSLHEYLGLLKEEPLTAVSVKTTFYSVLNAHGYLNTLIQVCFKSNLFKLVLERRQVKQAKLDTLKTVT